MRIQNYFVLSFVLLIFLEPPSLVRLEVGGGDTEMAVVDCCFTTGKGFEAKSGLKFNDETT